MNPGLVCSHLLGEMEDKKCTRCDLLMSGTRAGIGIM